VVGILVLGLALVASPAGALGGDDLLSDYALTSWGDGDGRPFGSVNAIAQDRDGYLWVGADAGLFRFDGSRFVAWDALGDRPLPPRAVRALFVSSDGTLWVGLGEGGGIHRIRDGRLQSDTQLLERTGSVTDFAEDSRTAMWAVSNRTLYRLAGTRWERIALPWPQREGLVLQPYVGTTGDLWVATRWGAFRRSAGSETFQHASEDYVFSISEDADGAIWTTDIARGFRRLGAAHAGQQAFEGAGARLLHDRKGNLWVATFDKGLWRVPPGTGPSGLSRVTRRNGLFSDSVRALMEDRDGNLWVGTTGGLHRLTERVLTPLENVGFVLTLAEGEDRHVWGGTSNGVIRLSLNPTARAPERIGSAGLDVRTLYSEPGGPLWAGTTDGLFRVVRRTLIPVPISSRPHMQVLSITPDGTGGVWLGDGAWLFRWKGSRLEPLVRPAAVADGTKVSVARGDSRGRLWIGFAGGLLGFLEPQGSFRAVEAGNAADQRAHTAIHAIVEDRSGDIWIGGSSGLSRFRDGRLATAGADNGLPGPRVLAIMEDAQQFLWLAVDRGVIRVAKQEVEKALVSGRYRMQYQLYDPLDGLAGAATGTTMSMQSSDGTIWLVRGGGVTLAHPDDLAAEFPARAPSPVRIEAAVANDRRLAPLPDTSVAAGTRRLEISYTVVSLTAFNTMRFRHRLDGLDSNWVDAGSRRTAFYTNLAPGTYRFNVEATAEDGAYTSAAAWDFTIQPAFYQTLWFSALVAAALVLAAWVAWRLRLGLVRRQFSLALAERVRLSREIHDTLLQSFVGVALQVDAVADGLTPSSAVRAQLVRIRHQVEMHIRDARQSIWELRSAQLDTQDLFSALRQFGRRTVPAKTARFTATVNGAPQPLSPKVQNQLLRIGQEAVINAVRHARATQIRLDLEFTARDVILRVSDNGRGFDTRVPDAEAHYGLTTMRERTAEVGGELRLTTGPGLGTAVEVIVPTRARAAAHEIMAAT
jgi:signal transduction histidine kinase/ligand-binding sensor domain-containing protein